MGAIKKLYMCKMHKFLYLDKIKENRPESAEGEKTTKKCRKWGGRAAKMG